MSIAASHEPQASSFYVTASSPTRYCHSYHYSEATRHRRGICMYTYIPQGLFYVSAYIAEDGESVLSVALMITLFIAALFAAPVGWTADKFGRVVAWSWWIVPVS